jgi:hypothetical protein
MQNTIDIVSVEERYGKLRNVHRSADSVFSDKSVPEHNIFVFKSSIVPSSLCRDLIDFITSHPDDAIVSTWGEFEHVIAKNIHFEENEELLQNFDLLVFSIIEKVARILRNTFGLKAKNDSGYVLREIYGPTRLHADHLYGDQFDEKKTKNARNLAVILALNDDFEGGQFYFPVQNITLKLSRGEVLVFPPYWTHPHLVTTPSSSRYTVNTWFFQASLYN